MPSCRRGAGRIRRGSQGPRLADRRSAGRGGALFGGSKLTLADIMMGFALTTMRAFIDHPMDAYPNILAYLQRIGARPAYRHAMAMAEPDMQPKLS